MVVRAAGNNLVTAGDELLAHGGGVEHYLLLVLLVFRLHGLVEGHGLCCNHVLKRTALDAGEHAGVEDCAHHLDFALRSGEAPGVREVLAHEDDTATGTAKSLMGCRCDDMCVLHRVLEKACGDEAGSMGHIDPKDCAYLVCNCAHALIVPLAGISRSTADDELWLAFKGLALHFIVVYASGFRIQAVCYGVIKKTAGIYRRTVGEVAAHGQVKTHEGVAGLEDGHCYGHVGLGAGVRLHVGILCIVELAEPVNCKLFYLVYYHAAAIIALAGITFRVFVGADGAHGFQYLIRHIVL